jgi:hypothetical protein
MSTIQRPPPLFIPPTDGVGSHSCTVERYEQADNKVKQREEPQSYKTPTTLFTDSPIKPSESYIKVVDPQRKKLIFVLLLLVIISPLIFRYACGSSGTNVNNSRGTAWAGDIDRWEWSVMVVLWLGILGNIFRLLPMVAGRPAAIEASQNCTLDGVAALGLCSPFSTEDDIILLRSLLGRTCTVFHTVGSRHTIQGLYLDAVLNERRISGEANRRQCWLAWMKFLNALVDVSLLMKEEAEAAAKRSAAEAHRKGGEGLLPDVLNDAEKSSPHPLELHCGSSDSTVRTLYVRGTPNTNGTGAFTPNLRRRSLKAFSSADSGSAPHTPASRGPPTRTPTFKDLNRVFDATRGVSDEELSVFSSWSREEYNHPLSYGMVAASPRTPYLVAPRTFTTDGGTENSFRSYRSAQNRLSLIPENPELEEQAEEEENPGICEEEHKEQTINNPGVWHDVALCDDNIRVRFDEESDVEMGQQPEDTRSYASASPLDTPGNRGRPSSLSLRLNAAMQRIAALRVDTQAHAYVPTARTDTAAPEVATEDLHTEAALPQPQERSVRFAIAPTPQARRLNARDHVLSTSHLRPHRLSNLELNMADILPMVDFLDSWLEELKQNEWTYDYHEPRYVDRVTAWR